jgi:hypothetical protein
LVEQAENFYPGVGNTEWQTGEGVQVILFKIMVLIEVKKLTQVTKQWPTSSGMISYFSSSFRKIFLHQKTGYLPEFRILQYTLP